MRPAPLDTSPSRSTTCRGGAWPEPAPVWGLLLVLAVAAACGDDQRPRGAAVIGPEGGKVVGVDGAELIVPAGALRQPVELAIARSTEDMPALPAGQPLGAAYEITPHGQRFALPATVRIPYDPAAVDPAQAVAVVKASTDGAWRRFEEPALANGLATVTISELSWLQVRQGPQLPLPDPPPMTTHASFTDLGGFVRFTATGRTPAVTILQQPSAVAPTRFEADVYVASTHPTCDDWATIRRTVRRAALYHLQGEPPAGINRVYVEDDTVGYPTTVETSVPHDTAIREIYAVDAADANWDSFAPFIEGLDQRCPYDCNSYPPDGAVFDNPALHVTLRLVCGNAASGRSFDLYAREYVVVPGFTFEGPVFLTQPAASVSVLEGEWLDNANPAVRYSVTSPGEPPERSWQRRNPGGPWAAVEPTDFPGPQGPGIADRHGELQAVGDTRDDGTELRVRACGTWLGTTACSTSNILQYQVTRNFPAPVFTGPPAGARWNVGQRVRLAAPLEAIPFPESVTWQTRAGAADAWADVDAGRYRLAVHPSFDLQTGHTDRRGTVVLDGIQPLTLADRGRQFRAIVTTIAGTATSDAATIDVTTGQAPPTITTQPQDVTSGAGLPVVLAATASGAVPLSFQWYKDGVRLVGANGPLLVLNGVTAADAGLYRLDVENVEDTIRSREARLTVTGGPATVPPQITQQPRGFAALRGSGITLAVTATGGAPLAYQWRKDGAAITGATGAMLPLMALADADAGAYSVVVTNGSGAVTSTDATVIVLPPLMAATEAPVITLQPMRMSVLEGSAASFTTAVTGTPTPSCQWTRNGVAIPLATSCAGYTTPPLAPQDDGATYNLVAFNPAGTVFGDGATVAVEVLQLPTITTPPQDQSVVEGATASFRVVATANGPLRFQWRRDGVDVPGATDNLYVVSPATLADSGAGFTVRVCNGDPALGRCVVSSAVRLTVGPVLPANALTALQAVATQNASVVLRLDRTVWAWGERYQRDGTMSNSIPPGDEALRPVRIFPAALVDVYQLTAWYDSYWALVGTPGTAGSRVLQWGAARAGNDGRGSDGAGGLGAVPAIRYNHAAPVVMLERVAGTPVPVDRVCAISGGGMSLLLVRAIAPDGTTTSCAPTADKTVWYAGTLTPYTSDASGVVVPLPGLPTDSPPAALFHGQTYSGTPPFAIALADGRLFASGDNSYNGMGLPLPAPSSIGGAGGPGQLPAAWGAPRRFAMSFYYALFVVRADGSVMTSGYDSYDELGVGDLPQFTRIDGPTPVLAETCTALPCADVLTGVTDLVTNSGLTTIAIKGGALLGWGNTTSGLLGPGFGAGATQPLPRPIAAPVAGFTAVSSANTHALALGPGGAVYAWGQGQFGALGDGVASGVRTAPALVTTP